MSATGEVVLALRTDVIGVSLPRGGEVLLKNRDETILLVEPALECGVRGRQAVMVKLQLGVCAWVDGGAHQLSAEVELPLSSQFLDG
jgi:hypothetical protein